MRLWRSQRCRFECEMPTNNSPARKVTGVGGGSSWPNAQTVGLYNPAGTWSCVAATLA
jgi:hypothetical protein